MQHYITLAKGKLQEYMLYMSYSLTRIDVQVEDVRSALRRNDVSCYALHLSIEHRYNENASSFPACI